MANTPDNQKLSYKEVVEAVEGLVRARKTGTVYLLTDTKHYVRVGLKEGRIAHLVFGKYRGVEAIEYFRQIRSATWSFAEDVISGSGELPLPPTPALLRDLKDPSPAPASRGAAADRPRSGRAEPEPEPRAERSPTPASPARAESEVPETLRGALGLEMPGAVAPSRQGRNAGPRLSLDGNALFEAVTQELALCIGPIAPMVTNEYRSDLVVATTLDALDEILIEICEERLDDLAQGETFRRNVLARATE